MELNNNPRLLGCRECAEGKTLDFNFSMALQPIVNTRTQQIFAYEALARGLNNEPAGHVLERVNDDNRYRFDQTCRVKAIELAAQLSVPTFLSINFMPNAVYRPELCIRTTLAAAETYGFPIEHIIFEFTEDEKVNDFAHLRGIVEHYKQRGFKTAIDDFGSGYAGLNLLAEIQTDLIKLDMELIRKIDQDKVRQAIVKGIMQTCRELSIEVIAEGVESYGEWRALDDLGIELIQGYYFAKPAFESLTNIQPDIFQRHT